MDHAMDGASATVIELCFEKREGTLYISSKDLPGLMLAGPDPSVIQDLIPAIKALYFHAHGVEVDVIWASPPDRFPEPVTGHSIPPAYQVAPKVVAVARR